MCVCVCSCVYKFQPIRIYLLLPTFLFNKTEYVFWSLFLVCELLHKIHLQVLSYDTCFSLPYMLSFIPSIHVADKCFFGYASLWQSLLCLSGVGLPYPFIGPWTFCLLVILTFVSIGWCGECWGAYVFSNRGFLSREGTGMGVPDDMDALFFIVSRGTTAHLSR